MVFSSKVVLLNQNTYRSKIYSITLMKYIAEKLDMEHEVLCDNQKL